MIFKYVKKKKIGYNSKKKQFEGSNKCRRYLCKLKAYIYIPLKTLKQKECY